MSERRARPRVIVWREAVRESALGRTPKLVAFGLSTYAGRGFARLARGTLAAACSLSDRGVDGGLKTVEAEKWLTVERTHGGNNAVNRYTLRLPDVPPRAEGDPVSAFHR